jgi:hypothetical protein
MNRKTACLAILAPVCFFLAPLLAQVPSVRALSISSMDSAQSLASALVGKGITISSVKYKGSSAAAGYFSDGIASGIGIQSGVVLTSGYAKNLSSGYNSSSSKSGYNYLPGDSQLDALIPGYSTYDASVLSFDFVSQGDSAYFNYVFGSEEYPEWVNSSFNDAFGFFVDGKNYALLPDSTPVTIDTVNDKLNADLYNNNSSGAYKLEYDGFTDVLTARLTGLTAGQSYNITLAIADAGDYGYDSGIFLEAGSFSDTAPPSPSPVPEAPSQVLLLGAALVLLGSYARRRKDAAGRKAAL